ncbi:MAG: sigma-70 family RNA polymerase sigma factor [Acutalibacteraceae bacterium]|nr:sigma-70 family RNA polymerase sigma factor [Acutalibacteraceae bacterium]
MVKTKAERDTFIENNLGLVHSICKRFSGRGIEYDDLYQAGCIGLIKATDAFDEDRGLCFSTYAVPVIMGEVRRLFRDGGSVKVSRSVKELSVKINYEKQRLEQTLCREPTVSELAEAIGVSAEDITEAVCATQPTVSLTYEGDDGIKETDLPTESYEEQISNRLILDEAFKKLNETERKIMNCRYFNFMTQSKTAEILNMSQVQVSRAEKRILLKLKGVLE